jgi:hypothetical protein
MTDAFDLNREDTGAGKGAQEYAAESIPHGEAKAPLERFDDEAGIMLLLVVHIDLEVDRLERIGKT